MFAVSASSVGDCTQYSRHHMLHFALYEQFWSVIPIPSPTLDITKRSSFSVGLDVMHICCTAALLMGFRSSSERYDNGTMEDPALTILHL